MSLNGYKISCIVPAYNEEPQIEDTLKALCKCEFVNEVIVVDDASSDGTLQIVNKLKDSLLKLKVITNSKNSGKTYSVKIGIEASFGDLILLVDADVIGLSEEYLFKMVQKFLTEKCGMVIIERGGDKIGPFVFINKMFGGERIFRKEDFLKMNIDSKSGYGIESILNKYFIKKHLRIKTVYCEKLYAVTHFKERGFIEAVKHYFKVAKEESRPLSAKDALKSFFFVEKDGLERFYNIYYRSKFKIPIAILIFLLDILLTYCQFITSLLFALRNNMLSKFY